MEFVLLCLSVSLDAFFGGFAIGLDGMRMDLLSAAMAASWVSAASAIAVFAGSFLENLVSESASGLIGFILLTALAALSLRSAISRRKNGHPYAGKNAAGLIGKNLLGLAIASDAAGASLAMSICGNRSAAIPLAFGIMHLFLLLLGNFSARRALRIQLLGRLLFAPSIMFFAMALLRLGRI